VLLGFNFKLEDDRNNANINKTIEAKTDEANVAYEANKANKASAANDADKLD
jgi:hypothetical protein